MISTKFLKNSLIYTVAGTLPMASAILLLPFYISDLTTDAYGALAIYLAFSALVQILVTFSFDSSIYIHFHEYKNDKSKIATFVSSVFIFILIIGLAEALILIVLGDYIFFNFLHNQKISFFPYGLIGIGIAIFQAIFKVYCSFIQSREQPVLFFWSNVTSFALIVLFTIGGLQLFPQSLLGPLVGRMLAGFISGALALAYVFHEFGFHFNYTLLKTSFSFNRYAFIYQLQQWTINNFDRMLMALYLPLADVGVYDFTLKCLLIIEFLVNGFSNSFLPKVVSIISSQTTKQSTLQINRYYSGLTVVIMLLVVSSIFLYPLFINALIELIGKDQYLMAVQYIPYAAIVYLFRGMRMYFGIPYGAMKYSKPLPVIYLIVSGVKIVGLVLLIESFGIYGVILSSLLSYLLEIILLYRASKGIFSFKFNLFKIIIAPVILALIIVSLETTLAQFYPTIIHFLYVILSLILILWAFRNEINAIRFPKLIR